MLSFKELSEKKKKTNILINPKKTDLQEKNHGEDCDCPKCEKKRRSEDVNDGPDIATEEACGKGMYYCHDDKKCKPIPEGYKEGKDGMLVKEAKYEAGASDYGKMSIRNKRAVGYGGNAAPPEERRKAHAERMKKHKKEDAEVYWSSKALDQLDEITAKDRMKRDAGAIAKKKMRNKEHKKYVNFLDVDEALHPNVAKNDAINKANAMKRAKEREASKPSADVIAARKRQYKGGSDYTTADKKKVIQSYKKEETILETPKGDVGKDRPTKEQDRAARSYGSGYGAKYNAPARKTIHKMKRGVKKYKGEKENNDGSTKMTNYIDDRKSHFHRQGKSYAEPSRKKVKEEVAISEKIKYDKKGSSMDYFLGKDPKKTEYYKKNAKKKNESKSSCECKHESFAKFLEEGNATGRMLQKSKTQVTGHISADRGSDEKKNQSKRKGLEKDLKKHKIGHKKGVGEYKYDSGETGREVSYQTSKPDKMSKRRFGKVMRRLGRKHGQESVITKDKDKPAKLHTTEKGSKEKSQTLGKSKAGKHPKGYGETSGTKVRSAKLPKKTNKSSYHYG